MFHKLLRIRLAATALAMPLCGALAHAECPCQQGQPLSVDAYGTSGGYADGQYLGGDPYRAGQYGAGTVPYGAGDRYGSGGVQYQSGMPASTAGTPLTPPPGTLGQTYQLRSDPVPADKHPRAGMIVVHAPGATNVLVQDTNNFRTRDTLKGFEDADHRGTWHFETIMMLNGQPNIHRVAAIYPADDGSRVEVRYVRFIMGRVVYLDI
jgi:hypothetical protein